MLKIDNARLATKISEYWKNRGSDISGLHFEEFIISEKQMIIYCLRSNMINGYPPKIIPSLPTRPYSLNRK